jgi:hypothetical protein
VNNGAGSGGGSTTLVGGVSQSRLISGASKMSDAPAKKEPCKKCGEKKKDEPQADIGKIDPASFVRAANAVKDAIKAHASKSNRGKLEGNASQDDSRTLEGRSGSDDNWNRRFVDTIRGWTGKWTVDEVKKILNKDDPGLLQALCANHVNMRMVDDVIDRWKNNTTGAERDNALGDNFHANTDKDTHPVTIRLNSHMTNQEAAANLFHELQHLIRPAPRNREESIQQEIDVRVATEEFRIRNGMGPTDGQDEYRKDGRPDRVWISQAVRASSHYNPTTETAVRRTYVRERPSTGWCPP